VLAFEYPDCTRKIAVPDQVRSAVSGPDRYDPKINPDVRRAVRALPSSHHPDAHLTSHGTRPRSETRVLIVRRWILVCLRNRVFFSRYELNAAVAELLSKLSTKPFIEAGGLSAPWRAHEQKSAGT
jgi:hypothetical protein